MYVTTQNGSIYSFDIQEIYEYIKEFDDTVNKIDEMKGIVLKDDHELIIKRNTFHTEKPFYPNDIPKLFWGAFKNDVDCIQYNSINNSGILTAFNNSNGTFKIFNLLGKEICR